MVQVEWRVQDNEVVEYRTDRTVQNVYQIRNSYWRNDP